MTTTTRLLALALASAALTLAGCGGASSSATAGGGTPPPPPDTTAPLTGATPPGGLYPAGQLVLLEASEEATIYYTVDGFEPQIGGLTTLSGPSPVQVAVTHDQSLKYFAVDASGNEGFVNTDVYSFDFNPPLVLLGQTPGSLGLLETGSVTFSADEQESATVTWSAELGGTSVPGSGGIIASGTTTPSTLTTFDVEGWRLPVGGSSTLHLFVADAAGGLGIQPIALQGLSDESVPFGGQTGSMVASPSGEFLYVARPGEARVLELGFDPARPSYLQEVQSFAVGPLPGDLAITPDGARLYATCDDGIYLVYTASGVVAQPVDPGVAASGSALTTDGTKLYFAGDDGLVRFMNTDPLSGGFHSINSLVPFEAPMSEAELALSSDGMRALLAWRGNGQYGVNYLNTDPTAPDFLARLVAPTPLSGGLLQPRIDPSGTRAWLAEGVGRLARASLQDEASAIQTFHASLTPGGVHLAPGEDLLFLSGDGLAGLRVLDAETLDVLGFVPSGTSGQGGTSRDLVFSPDGRRATFIRDQGTTSAAFHVLQLTH